MNKKFSCIGIVGHPRHTSALATHKMLYHWLTTRGYRVIIEPKVAQDLKLRNAITGSLDDIGKGADLAVVVGGDGNMLSAARVLASHDIKVIGVNRGNLGFLTDLDPDNALRQLTYVLEGKYIDEQHFLLETSIYAGGRQSHIGSAINEVILHPDKVAHMIEFEVYIDDHLAFSQRSDGLIIATPIGSTAYALSAGGPILSPSIEAVILVPMFPHTLSARPLVIRSNSVIRLKFSQIGADLKISCDGQVSLPIQEGQQVLIRRSNSQLNLIHSNDYSYFKTLNSKLGWSKNLF